MPEAIPPSPADGEATWAKRLLAAVIMGLIVVIGLMAVNSYLRWSKSEVLQQEVIRLNVELERCQGASEARPPE